MACEDRAFGHEADRNYPSHDSERLPRHNYGALTNHGHSSSHSNCRDEERNAHAVDAVLLRMTSVRHKVARHAVLGGTYRDQTVERRSTPRASRCLGRAWESMLGKSLVSRALLGASNTSGIPSILSEGMAGRLRLDFVACASPPMIWRVNPLST